MAQKTETANAVVTMDGTSAKQELDKINAKLKDLRAEKKKFEDSGALNGFKNVEKEIAGLTSAQRQLKNQTFDVNQVMKNLNNTSLKDLEKAYRLLSNEIKRSEQNAEGLENKIKQSKAIKNEINTLKSHYNDLGNSQESFFSKASNGFNKYAGVVAGASATFAGMVLAGKAMVKEFETFEDASANLSSLTGLKGDDLKFMEDAAKQMSVSSKEGVKFTQSADQILKGMTVIGSVKSELLKDKDALRQVTEEGLILAAAAKMETGPALESLGNIMNQFNAPASESSRYINVLAAGSKEGAAEISMLSESFVKAGTVLKMANIPIEQSTAIFETLADKGLKGADAGTALRGVMLKLQSGADEYNPKVVGLSKALENLANANLSVEERTKMFGQEGVVAGSILIDNRQRVADLTKAVTGTSTAYEMARTNTSTHSATMAQATNQFKLQAIELGQRLAPVMTFSTNVGTKFLKLLMNFPTIVKENRGLFIALGVALIALNAAKIKSLALSALEYLSLQKGIGATIKYELAMAKLIFMEEYHRISMLKGAAATNIFTVASNALKAAWATNPFGIAIVALGVLAGAFSALSSKTNDSTTRMQKWGDSNAEAYKKLATTEDSLNNLGKTIKDLTISESEHGRALQKSGFQMNENTNFMISSNAEKELQKKKDEERTAALDAYNQIAEANNLLTIAESDSLETLNQKMAANLFLMESRITTGIIENEIEEALVEKRKLEKTIASGAADGAETTVKEAIGVLNKRIEALRAEAKGYKDVQGNIEEAIKKQQEARRKAEEDRKKAEEDKGSSGSSGSGASKEKEKGAYEKLNEEISKLTQEYQNLITQQNSGIAIDANTLTATEKQIIAKKEQKKAIDKLIESKIGEAKEGEKEKTQWQKLGEEINTYNDQLMELITRRQKGEKVSEQEIERIANEIKLRTTAQKAIQDTSKELTTMISVYDKIMGRVNIANEAMNKEIMDGEQALLDNLNKGTFVLKDIEAERLRIKEEAEEKAYAKQLDLLQKSLLVYELSADERKKIESQIFDIKNKMMDKDFKKFVSNEEKKKKAEDKRRELIRKGEEILINSVGTLITNSLEAKKNEELATIDETTENKKAKLEAEKASGLITEAEYKQKLAVIEKDALAEKLEVEQKAKLWQIAADMAVGIAKAVAESPYTLGAPASTIILAEGLAQAAIVAISPQFRDGNTPDTVPVMGASDGVTYDAVPGGSAKTGFYNRPTLLVSEDARNGKIGEMVISSRDLENKAVMQHARAIAAISSGQYRNGNTPSTVVASDNSNLERLLTQLVENTSNSYNFRDLDDTLIKVQKKKAFEKTQFKG